MESVNDSLSGPTLIMENNQSTIIHMKKDRFTPRIRQLDIVLTWLHYQYIRGIFLPFYIDTKKDKGGMNTKPLGGEIPVGMLLLNIRYKFYLPTTSTHYILLDLHKYNISIHRGSSLLPNKGKYPIYSLHQTDLQSLNDHYTHIDAP